MKNSERPARLDLVTQSVLVVYGAVRHEGRLADRALEYVLRKAKHLYSHERRMVAERVYGLLRSQRLVDWVLTKGAPRLATASPTQQDLARVLVAQSLEEPNTRWLKTHPLVNDDLRALIERVPSLLSEITSLDPKTRFALEASLPDFLADLFWNELGERAVSVARAMNQRGPLTARVNTLKTTREALIEDLQKEGVVARPCKRAPLGLTLETRTNVYSLGPFRDGLFEVQDEGSQLLGQLVDPMPTKAIDACAGAGGKTMQLAAEMKNRGELFAMDIDERRLEDLKDRTRRAGVHNTRVVRLPEGDEAVETLKPYVGKADRVLIDAPCSGTGTFRRKPDARYRLTNELLDDHVRRQHVLLERFATLVKPGGRVVYGTCSILRAENEDVVGAFLAKHPEFSVVNASERLGEGSGDMISSEGYLRLWPDRHDTDGFFGAILKKAK